MLSMQISTIGIGFGPRVLVDNGCPGMSFPLLSSSRRDNPQTSECGQAHECILASIGAFSEGATHACTAYKAISYGLMVDINPPGASVLICDSHSTSSDSSRRSNWGEIEVSERGLALELRSLQPDVYLALQRSLCLNAPRLAWDN